MASKGPKTSATKPAARKAPARPADKAVVTPPFAAAAPAPQPTPASKLAASPVAKAPEPAVAPRTEEAIASPAAATPAVEPTITPAVEPVAAIAPKYAESAERIVEEPKKETLKMATTVKDSMETVAAKGQAMFAEMNDRAKTAMEKNAKLVEEFNDFAKGNVEALVESGKIAAKGLESLGHDAAEYGRKNFETASATLKQLASAKSPTDFFKLQGDFMRQAFDSMVAEASKNTEAMIKLAGDAAQPLSNRLAVAADKVKVTA